MERIESYTLRWLVGVILLVFSDITAFSSTDTIPASAYDSVHVSLLTCSPHPEVYSLYGHTAVRYEDKSKDVDFVVNYGVFDFSTDYFIMRFAFGITDYQMGIVPFDYFVGEYRSYGSSIIQQEINLTPAEKEAVFNALNTNYQPQNRVYRYNYFYKNCSTMARDIITDNIDGRVEYKAVADRKSFREMIHSCNEDYPWARLGNDMLLGMRADFNTDAQERHFLPLNLKEAFDDAVIISRDGKRPLVKSTTVLLEKGAQKEMEGFPLTPFECFGILFALSIAIGIIEVKRKKMMLWFDILLMLSTGIAGILIFMMLFSQHPTTSTNLLVLMLNPVPLFYIHGVVKSCRAGKPCVWWKIWFVMAVLTLLSAIFLQEFDSSMVLLDFVILIRSVSNISHERNLKLRK